MIISLIAAYTADSEGRQVIGKDGGIPWKIRGDMSWFKENTLDSAIVMGRKTHESIGRVLPGRDNIILTTDPSYEVPGGFVFSDLEKAFQFASTRNSECFIIGGQSLYESTIERADRVFITFIKNNPGYEGDTFFPQWDRHKFKLIHKEYKYDPQNGAVSFKVYQRRFSDQLTLQQAANVEGGLFQNTEGEGV